MVLWPLNMQQVKLHNPMTAQAFKYIRYMKLHVIYFLLHLQVPGDIKMYLLSWNKPRCQWTNTNESWELCNFLLMILREESRDSATCYLQYTMNTFMALAL